MKKVLNIAYYVVFGTLILFLIINFILIFYSRINGDNSTLSIFGYKFYVEETDSMAPAISKGDLIVTRVVDVETLAVNDIIVYYNEDNVAITHRIKKIEIRGDATVIQTKGDKSKSYDEEINSNQYDSKYIFKIAGLGAFIKFLSTQNGILCLVLTIFTVFILSYFVSIVKKEGKNNDIPIT